MLRRLAINTPAKSAPKFQGKSLLTRNLSTSSKIKRADVHDIIHYVREFQTPIILDVRPRTAWESYRIQGSLPFPLDKLKEKATKLPKDNIVFVHCDKTSHVEPETEAEATDSLKAAAILKEMGFSDVRVVDGSVDEFIKAGFYYHKIPSKEQPQTTAAPK